MTCVPCDYVYANSGGVVCGGMIWIGKNLIVGCVHLMFSCTSFLEKRGRFCLKACCDKVCLG